ncbi:isocitrate lyase/PEP mutase family protein [Pontibacter fetidus]|uniref:Isocitrate lyase/phosphoenolpyruvate mutase family protein n=1 Tax=Pontibacter fetidus TaxID=2700082 RepID=A0A6B2H7S0_9BACT|nr:isocitrate lyase/phosphoenolpyruvate mutase family protein [Pontibacter fetidus]NDK57006.1 isocitrate lyase/phosphoenolpyruvate mutase family protein [Pontibacter fetidus]
MTFKQLHQQNKPLLICNVWDVASARIAEQQGFEAIGTSSAAMASMLGYEDGEKMEFAELAHLVKRIAANTSLPLSVDIESGYSRNTSEIIENINVLADLGVAGINIEDSLVANERTLCDSYSFARTLETIKEAFLKNGTDLFLNVRTDTFIVGHPNQLQETIVRAQLYETAGADGIFVPCIVAKEDISAVTGSTSLPLNVMCMPNLPAFKELKRLGVKRISMGNFLFGKLYDRFAQLLQDVKTQENFNPVFELC